MRTSLYRRRPGKRKLVACAMVNQMGDRPSATATAVLLCLLVAAGWMSRSDAGTPVEVHDVPLHATRNVGDQGWTCDAGFRQLGQLCVSDTHGTPDRGAFEVFNGRWRCRSGYHLDKGFCVPFTAPEHGRLVGDNGEWQCDWGFGKAGSRCKEINPPLHGYLDASGHEWVCYPGFERMSDQCVPTPDPASAPVNEPVS